MPGLPGRQGQKGEPGNSFSSANYFSAKMLKQVSGPANLEVERTGFEDGKQYVTGPSGPPGLKGERGAMGLSGLRGEKGEKGEGLNLDELQKK